MNEPESDEVYKWQNRFGKLAGILGFIGIAAMSLLQFGWFWTVIKAVYSFFTGQK